MAGERFTVVRPAPPPTDSHDNLKRTLTAFCEAVSRGDPDTAAACFASDARLLTPDGTEVSGRPGIRGVLAQLTALSPEFSFEEPRLIAVGEVALCTQRWSMRVENGQAGRFEQSATSTAVLRQGAECWEFLISALWGRSGEVGNSDHRLRPAAPAFSTPRESWA